MPYKNPDDRKKYYQANKAAYKARAIANRHKQRERIRDAIRSAKNTPCADCKLSYPYYVMQFDHTGDKAFTISAYVRLNLTYDRVVAEIAKCDVVCANCHAQRTHQRRADRAGIEPADTRVKASLPMPAEYRPSEPVHGIEPR